MNNKTGKQCQESSTQTREVIKIVECSGRTEANICLTMNRAIHDYQIAVVQQFSNVCVSGVFKGWGYSDRSPRA